MNCICFQLENINDGFGASYRFMPIYFYWMSCVYFVETKQTMFILWLHSSMLLHVSLDTGLLKAKLRKRLVKIKYC